MQLIFGKRYDTLAFSDELMVWPMMSGISFFTTLWDLKFSLQLDKFPVQDNLSCTQYFEDNYTLQEDVLFDEKLIMNTKGETVFRYQIPSETIVAGATTGHIPCLAASLIRRELATIGNGTSWRPSGYAKEGHSYSLSRFFQMREEINPFITSANNAELSFTSTRRICTTVM